VWNLKPERWGSPLVQEKYQEESLWQDDNNNNNNNFALWQPQSLITFTLEHATKAQTGSRVIAVLFL
jgi:aspartyl aminopeptidase